MASRVSFFNRAAASWDNHPQPDPSKLEYILSFLPDTPIHRVLDAGCGTGILLPLLARFLNPAAEIYAVDQAEAMLRSARAKYDLPNVKYLHGDVTKLDFPVETVDAIICYSLYPHLDDKAGAIKGFAELLKPTGRLIIAHSQGRTAINQIHHNLGGPVAADLLPSASETAQLCQRNGLTIIVSRDDKDYYLVVAEKPSRE